MHEDFTRRTLRLWGLLGLGHGLALATLLTWFVPWKTPWVNVLLLVFSAAELATGVGLWRLKRWAYRLALALALVGMTIGLLVVTALVLSWAYLHGIFGDFGEGAALFALIVAALAFVVLGLFFALQLRALLRREVRTVMRQGSTLTPVLIALCVLPPLAALGLNLRFALSALPAVSAEGRAQALAVLRAALDRVPLPAAPALVGTPTGVGPLQVTLWHAGRPVARVSGAGVDLAQAVRAAADALAARRTLPAGQGRLRVDRLVGAAPLLSEHPAIVALSINPGRDALRRAGAQDTAIILPDEMVAAARFGVRPLLPSIPELRLGADARALLDQLGSGDDALGQLQRVRVESWVESPAGPLPVSRANTPGPKPMAAAFATAAIAGGDYLLGQLLADGRFHYRYRPTLDRHEETASYNLPRHAGTAYALAELYGLTKEVRFRQAAWRAIGWLVQQIPAGGCGDERADCISGDGVAKLGSTALALVALYSYVRHTGDRAQLPRARRLAAHLLRQQKPSGDFYHRYLVDAGRPDPETRSMFYSEEAALALMLGFRVTGERRLLEAARRALDFLTHDKYRAFFLGWFVYGPDHWTCIAAQQAWPELKNPQYVDFCRGYAAFIGRIQYQPGQWDNEDFAGHYGVGALMVPQAPAAAGFSEAIVSTLELSRHHGLSTAALERQLRLGLAALTRDQLRADNCWVCRNPDRAIGGVRRSLVEPEMRIDFTQHAVAALARGAAALGWKP